MRGIRDTRRLWPVQADEALGELGTDLRLHLFRNNLDSQGNSYAATRTTCCTDAATFRQVADALVAFFVTRQILVGNGWINTGAATPRLQFSQRADQMWDAVSSATTRSRPIINTRDRGPGPTRVAYRTHARHCRRHERRPSPRRPSKSA